MRDEFLSERIRAIVIKFNSDMIKHRDDLLELELMMRIFRVDDDEPAPLVGTALLLQEASNQFDLMPEDLAPIVGVPVDRVYEWLGGRETPTEEENDKILRAISTIMDDPVVFDKAIKNMIDSPLIQQIICKVNPDPAKLREALAACLRETSLAN
jgi:hypothetical protein